MLRLASCLLFAVADASLLDAPLFSSGMILQRGETRQFSSLS
jgi:hypothetical protein